MSSSSSATANPLSQTEEDDSHPDLMDLFQRREAKSQARLEASRRERRYDKDRLSDKDLERLTITIRNESGEDKRITELQKKEEHENHNKYKHHSFVKKWKPLSPKAPSDEEWFINAPEILPENDPGYLCEMCRHLNFEVLFTGRGLPGNNVPSQPTQIKLHALGKVMDADNTCAFCRLLRRKMLDDGTVSHLTEDDINDSPFSINVIDEGKDYAIRLEIVVGEDPGMIGRFVVQRVEEGPQQALMGRFVQQERADMDRLRQWLQICEETHTASDESPDPALKSLRVIDTEDFCVREMTMPCRYACLSYVWGTGSQTQYTTKTKNRLEALNGLREAAAELPQTIRDAIQVARESSLRYLWVDALCILQDDTEDKAKIISKMGLIYGGATLTIIASTNADPHEGLPGAGTVHRPIAQNTANIQGMTLAVALHDPRQPIQDIDGSVWSSRAWTFQERALSPRSVHFTRSQMAFECIHGAVMLEEAVPVPDPAFRHSAVRDQEESDLMSLIFTHRSLDRFPNKGLTSRDSDAVMMMTEEIDLKSLSPEERMRRAPVFHISVDAPRDFFGMLGDVTSSTPWDMYRRAVDDYTKRKLTWDIDAVNAFSGVEHIIRRGINTKFWWGLPEFALEEALMWQAGEPLELRSDEDGGAIFPTWSWTAWRGHVSYAGRGWKNSARWDSVSVVRWIIREEPEWLIGRIMRDSEMPEDERAARIRQAAGLRMVLRETDFYPLRHLDTVDQDSWIVERDEVLNRHLYTHEAYPGIRFTYPVNLPGQLIEDRPDENGVLFFIAHAVPVITCDMQERPFKAEVEDRFLQIGTNDESRSSNYRPTWQRIVYHQGYRAGFLSLNTDVLPVESDGCEYHLVAISRGSLSCVPPPPLGWDTYWDMEPRKLQETIIEDEWRHGPNGRFAPDETVEPWSRPQNEDGDPHWDIGRFNVQSVFDVYHVLLLRTRNGLSTRMGAGKVNFSAFMAATPEEMTIKLG